MIAGVNEKGGKNRGKCEREPSNEQLDTEKHIVNLTQFITGNNTTGMPYPQFSANNHEFFFFLKEPTIMI